MKSKIFVYFKLACFWGHDLKALIPNFNNWGSGLFVLIVLLLFNSCNCSKPVQPRINKTLIKGTVTDSLTGQPLQHTVVTTSILTAVTDAFGNYRLTGIAGGTYPLVFDHTDYRLNYGSATVAKDDSVVVNIKLSPCQWEIVPLNMPFPWSSYVNVISDIFFANELEGWAVGFYHEWGWPSGYGVILHSIDGGYNWEILYGCPTPEESYYDIEVKDNLNMLACGPYQIRSTVDGGVNWAEYQTNPADVINAISFININEGWFARLGMIYKTTDGGVTWVYISSITGVASFSKPIKMKFINKDVGWVRSSTSLNVTRDGGITWTTVFDDLPNPKTFSFALGAALDVLPSGHIWVEGKHSTNNGMTWVDQPYDTTWHYFSSSFCDTRYGWRSGANHALTEHGFYHTIDGGKTWAKSSIPGISYIHSVHFINERRGWAVGWVDWDRYILIYK
jgi:photosystem II stability/assembly factor-like uncharacterized protein